MKKPMPMKPSKMKMRLGKPVAKAAAGGVINMSPGAMPRSIVGARPMPSLPGAAKPGKNAFMPPRRPPSVSRPTTGGELPAMRKGGVVPKAGKSKGKR